MGIKSNPEKTLRQSILNQDILLFDNQNPNELRCTTKKKAYGAHNYTIQI